VITLIAEPLRHAFNLVDDKLEQTHYSIDHVLPQKLYNARPGSYLPIVVQTSTGLRVDRGLWGIKTEFTKSPLINAKSESLFTSGFWKRYRNNRCLIPADGFFEWKARPAL
jgi:putative SOS response-associated peptidase YedK